MQKRHIFYIVIFVVIVAVIGWQHYKISTLETDLVESKLKTIYALDSLNSKIEKDYRWKLDSLDMINTDRINSLKISLKADEKSYRDLGTIVGQLPEY